MAPDILLRLSGQRALLANVPPSLRAASAVLDGNCIVFRAIFDRGASPQDKELLSIAATDIVADFPRDFSLKEEFTEIAAPERMDHLEYVLFLRGENGA